MVTFSIVGSSNEKSNSISSPSPSPLLKKSQKIIIKKYKDKESDDLQEDLKNEINKALDKILEESK